MVVPGGDDACRGGVRAGYDPVTVRLRGWLSHLKLEHPKRVVPANAVLYFFVWVAAVHVVYSRDNPHIDFDGAGLGDSAYYWWNALILLGPLLAGGAYLLITRASGSWKVLGFWLRFGADTAVFTALLAIIITRFIVLYPAGMGDGPLFALISLTGVCTYSAMLMVRDIGTLLLLEHVAGVINSGETE